MVDDAVCGPLLEEIRGFVGRVGYPPTRRELRAALGLSSTDTVARHLRHLVRDGAIEMDGARAARGMRLVAREGGS